MIGDYDEARQHVLGALLVIGGAGADQGDEVRRWSRAAVLALEDAYRHLVCALGSLRKANAGESEIPG